MTLSQWQLFKVAELTFLQLADIPSFTPHFCCFCLGQEKNMNKDFKEVQVKPHEF
jgi:hypothetical protein